MSRLPRPASDEPRHFGSRPRWSTAYLWIAVRKRRVHRHSTDLRGTIQHLATSDPWPVLLALPAWLAQEPLGPTQQHPGEHEDTVMAPSDPPPSRVLTRWLPRAAASAMASALTLVLLVTACGADGHDDGRPQRDMTDKRARAVVFSEIRAQGESADAIWYADDLGDYLPSQMIRLGGGRTKQFSPEGIVRGSFFDAQVAAAFRLGFDESGEETTRRLKDPYDPQADWRTTVVRLRVAEAWSDEVAEGDVITISVSSYGPDARAVDQGLNSMDDVLIALDGSWGRAGADYGIGRGGELLGQVVDGRISFPSLESDGSFLHGLETPGALTRAEHEAQSVIEVGNFSVVAGDD